MSGLQPYPFEALIRRAFHELETQGTIFDLPQSKFFGGDADHDYTVSMHGRAVSSPVGPAAGPHTQMAQNIVLAWLGGSRIMELKTVQILDELEIPRPCIDMENVGYNVEWSQELKLEASLEEYVKASMLIELLVASGKIVVAPGFERVRYDMSVGYDLEGVKTERVHTFIAGLMDASATVERLRQQIPDELGALRSHPFETRIADSLTLSTFHGCPPDEIEQIVDYLFKEHGLNVIVKLNPTLLGEARLCELMHEVMGYDAIHVPKAAFEKDAKWEQVVAFIERLDATARSLGLGFGVKFSNTLLVHNHKDLFKGEDEMYLSGAPLHVLAMNLVAKFRAHFGDRFPVSYSGGIIKENVADAVALGLTPVTVCSDLLRKGGYGRQKAYYKQLGKRMDAVGASHIDDFVLKAYGRAERALAQLTVDDEAKARATAALAEADTRAALNDDALYAAWVSRTRLLNTEHYVAQATIDPRYGADKNSKAPRKVGSHLALFDCLTCGICVPVCPNDANFTFNMPALDTPVYKASRDGDGWSFVEHTRLSAAERHQIGNFADFCNECGNCEVFCPELGGPYRVKPSFFSTRAQFEAHPEREGFWLGGSAEQGEAHGRTADGTFSATFDGQQIRYAGPGFAVQFDAERLEETFSGEASGDVDLGYYLILRYLHAAVLGDTHLNYLNVLGGER